MSSGIVQGDCLEVMAKMEPNSVDCIVTSPPYWGLRDYGDPNAWGLEPTLEEYLARMRSLGDAMMRVLKPTGTLWLNMGDAYASAWPCNRRSLIGAGSLENGKRENRPPRLGGLKEKDLIGLPWRVAFALQEQGWYLRSDIVWHKPNPMPESVRDRPTRAHEYVFLLTKSAKYCYDADAISEPISPNTHARLSQDVAKQIGSHRANGGAKTNGTMKAVKPGRKMAANGSGTKNNPSFNEACCLAVDARNARSVWMIATQSYREAHFATFPEELPKRCILAGCPEGGLVFDPFCGSGTTGAVAVKLGRKFIGAEINPQYVELAKKRMEGVTGSLFAEAG